MEGYAAPRGPSIIEMITAQLDRETRTLKVALPTDASYAYFTGRARGIADALAIVLNPYAPDGEAVFNEAWTRVFA